MKRLISLSIVAIALSISGSVYAKDPAEIAEGERMWANNCTRCHNARSPMERNDREWATIVAHMRARANLTRTEARQVAVYLQTMNGVENTIGVSSEESETKNQSSSAILASRTDSDELKTLPIRAKARQKLEIDIRRFALITRR